MSVPELVPDDPTPTSSLPPPRPVYPAQLASSPLRLLQQLIFALALHVALLSVPGHYVSVKGNLDRIGSGAGVFEEGERGMLGLWKVQLLEGWILWRMKGLLLLLLRVA